MDFFKKLKGELIDIIEWLDDTNNTLVYRFQRYNNEIKNGAKLIVREGQMAVFIDQGQIADVFQSGMYTLSTDNLPVLSTLKGWKYGFNSPFKAEVYFISTRNFTDQRWGTKNAITVSDDRFGMIDLRAFGTYVFKIKDGGTFIKEIVGTDGHFTNDEVAAQLRSMIVARFTDALGEANLPVEKYAANTNELSEAVWGIMRPEFEEYGIDLTKFLVENVSMPEEVKKEIFELSRLDKIDLNKLAQMKAAKAMEKAAGNDSGAAGAGIGMGMGYAMANQMGTMFNQPQNTNQQQPQNNQQNTSTPPPVPQASSYFVVLNNQQAGPFDMNTLKQMVGQNQITKDSLVWKEGMAAWSAAGQVAELASVFSSVPPPLPPPLPPNV